MTSTVTAQTTRPSDGLRQSIMIVPVSSHSPRLAR